MTNRNLNSKPDPFLLRPVGKDYIWGGHRLADDFAKDMEAEPLAETWECSTHPDGTSLVASGKDAGKLLTDVLKEHPEYLGSHPDSRICENGELPILIKLIDAKQDLSVQVHPDDAYAKQMEHGSLGKSEMWYVLDASKDAKIYYGFHHQMNPDSVRKSVEQGDIEKYLQKVPVKKNDVFYIEAGMVHAIGAGTLVAEIQENSNLTYRLYDYDRTDKAGQKRPLHIEKALDVLKYSGGKPPRQPMRVIAYQPGAASELLCRCKYFQVERMLINTERCRQMASVCSSSVSFEVLLCVDGCGTLFIEDMEPLPVFKGDCIFVPADSKEIRLHGQMQLLRVRC